MALWRIFNLKVAGSLCTSAFLIVSNVAQATGIWPFNTAYMEARQICTNASFKVKYWVREGGASAYKELLDELNQEAETDSAIKRERPVFHHLYYEQQRRSLDVVRRNPGISAANAEAIIDDECAKRQQGYEDAIRESK